MFGWGKKKQVTPLTGGADTFVDATGGGWGEPPLVVAADGGSQADYVQQQLELAAIQAQDVAVGETFSFTLTNIPLGITSPHEIAFGLMMRAGEYGLLPGVMSNETIEFERLN